MEQAGPRSAHGFEGPGVPDAEAAAFRIPAQPRPAERSRPRGVTSDAVGDGTGSRPDGATASARGEHTHGEAPIPRPRGAGTPSVVPAQGTRPGSRDKDTRSPDPDEHRSAGPADALRPGAPADDPRAGVRARPVVQRASVRGQILDALRTALVAGELAPGEVYSAPALGDRFGVSATPVREAMQQLALEGAVEVVPNRGFRVIERGTRELAELAEIRGLIEVPVMLRLARTVPAARWAELRPLAEATVRAASSGCRATYAETDRTFHRAVLALAGNAQLVRIADDLHRRAQWPLVGGPVSRGRADLVADAAEHTALLDALTAGDLAVVQALVREHFTGAS
ncbi:FCD domain-containing protein [Streptomyces sp. NPDC048643]|uniref:GntR family transcriptional regulator n=1 Tax=Streptomyces sp. NPDC048643 TaxID=3155637 RepID=UPI00341DB2A8